MAYHIAVCDDSPADRDYVSGLAGRWARDRGHEWKLGQFSSAENFLFRLGEERWDILLLDVEMGKMDGVSMARELRKANDAIQIVFITGYSEYISEGYDVAALHYLLKPVGEEKLFAVLDRAAAAVRKSERTLALELPGETVRVPLRQVRYVEVRGNYVTIHAREVYTVKKTLSVLEQELGEGFYRVGRSLTVNLSWVSRVTREDVCLNDGTVLPLPRGSYQGINRAIIEMD